MGNIVRDITKPPASIHPTAILRGLTTNANSTSPTSASSIVYLYKHPTPTAAPTANHQTG
jgi:hypothetical protein